MAGVLDKYERVTLDKVQPLLQMHVLEGQPVAECPGKLPRGIRNPHQGAPLSCA